MFPFVCGFSRLTHPIVCVLLGNTRVIGQEQLQKFQKEMGKVMKDPYQVVMQQTKLPISLLKETSKVRSIEMLPSNSMNSYL